MPNQNQRIEELEDRVGDIEEKIKPKRAKTHGDPIVELNEEI